MGSEAGSKKKVTAGRNLIGVGEGTTARQNRRIGVIKKSGDTAKFSRKEGVGGRRFGRCAGGGQQRQEKAVGITRLSTSPGPETLCCLWRARGGNGAESEKGSNGEEQGGRRVDAAN